MAAESKSTDDDDEDETDGDDEDVEDEDDDEDDDDEDEEDDDDCGHIWICLILLYNTLVKPTSKLVDVRALKTQVTQTFSWSPSTTLKPPVAMRAPQKVQSKQSPEKVRITQRHPCLRYCQ